MKNFSFADWFWDFLSTAGGMTAVMGQLRHGMTALGGGLAARGWVTNSNYEFWSGVVLAVLGWFLSVEEKRRRSGSDLPIPPSGGPSGGAGAVVTMLCLAALMALPLISSGCQSASPERTAITAFESGNTGLDAALKSWAVSWRDRQAAAVASSRSDPSGSAAALNALQAERSKVNAALAEYQRLSRASVDAWLSFKANTNAPTAGGSGVADAQAALAEAVAKVLAAIGSGPDGPK